MTSNLKLKLYWSCRKVHSCCHFLEWINQGQLSAPTTCQHSATKAPHVHSDTSRETDLLCANIGSEVFVKREMTVNSCMNLTCQRCLNVSFFLNLVSATTKNALFFTLILRIK